MQKTNFPFEAVIHDDASTDKTRHIIEEYALKYPDIIKPVYEKENQYSKGDYKFINDTFQRAAGKYIAFCEGDDYWTDPDKLQTQVDYMESNPGVTVCFHPVEVVFEDGATESKIYPDDKDVEVFTLKELLRRNYIQSNSVLYRRRNQNYSNLALGIIPSDWYMHLYHAQNGRVGFINKVMSAYRKHPGGVWWDSKVVWKKYGEGHLRLYGALLEIYGDNPEYGSIIKDNIRKAFKKIYDASDSVDNVASIISSYPGLIVDAFISDRSLQAIYNEESNGIFDAKAMREKDRAINNLSKRLAQIEGSKGYRIGRILTALPRRIKMGAKLLVNLYIPDDSNTPHDKRSEALDLLLNKYYQYRPKLYGLRVAVISRGISSSPTSSFFIRLASPLTWGWSGKRVNLSLYDGNIKQLPHNIDVCIVQRTAFDTLDNARTFFSDISSKGIKLVVDTDDAFARLDPSHPQYAVQKGRVEALEYIVEKADKMWASTDYIASNHPRAVVYPNTLDPRVWRYRNGKTILRPGTISVLYMGTMTHGGDLELVLPAIDKINKKYKNAISLTVIGVASSLPDRNWLSVIEPPKDEVVYPKFVSWLLDQKKHFDLGIAPLVASEFNKAKSDIKVLDYLAMGLLPVVSELEPYSSSELDPFIVRVGYGDRDWFDALEHIIKNRKSYSNDKAERAGEIEDYIERRRATSSVSKRMLKDLRSIKRASAESRKGK